MIYRVVPKGAEKVVSDIHFTGYGSHVNEYHCAYLTVAAALGVTKREIDVFVERLHNVFAEVEKKSSSKHDGSTLEGLA